jgi:DNA-binding transcriptional ArsR family regulator
MSERKSEILSEGDLEALRGDQDLSPELQRMIKNAREASDFLKALAHESRLVILCLLAERERSVTELEDLLSLRQTTVSQQLARLRLDDLVVARRDGKAVYYSLADEQLKQFIRVIYDMFCKKG